MSLKISNFLKVVAVLLAVVAALGFVSTLFRTPSSSPGKTSSPSVPGVNAPGTEDPGTEEALPGAYFETVYAVEAKSGTIYLHNNSDIVFDAESNGYFCNAIDPTTPFSYVCFCAADSNKKAAVLNEHGYILDLTLHAGNEEILYLPSMKLEIKMMSDQGTVWVLGPNILQNVSPGGSFTIREGANSIEKSGEVRLTYVVRPIHHDGVYDFWFDLYLDGRIFSSQCLAASISNAYDTYSFESFRCNFNTAENASYFNVTDFGFYEFGGIFEGASSSRPASDNDAFIQAFLKDRSVLYNIPSSEGAEEG
ncbi:MAG: hypothetical protein J6J66_02185 [Clostridia bacterium]|nr:hypothetical protein [Clostridia bacterium]